jgi:hypothetical protein
MVKMIRKKIRFLIFFLSFIGSLSWGEVDYTNWLLRITVKNSSEEVDSVLVKVENQAKDKIRNLVYDREHTVEEFLKNNFKQNLRFQHLRLKITESDRRFLSDGTVITEYEIPLLGEVLKSLIPETQTVTYLAPLVCPCCKRPWPENFPVPEGIKLIPLENEILPKYTGVLIDARDLKIRPAFFPRIITEDTQEVYSVNFANLGDLSNTGLVRYVSFSDIALINELVGENPLRITAVKSAGKYLTDIVISNTAGKSLHGSMHNLLLLEKCKVVVIYNE